MRRKQNRCLRTGFWFLQQKALNFWSHKVLFLNSSKLNPLRLILLICKAEIVTFNHYALLWELKQLTSEKNWWNLIASILQKWFLFFSFFSHPITDKKQKRRRFQRWTDKGKKWQVQPDHKTCQTGKSLKSSRIFPHFWGPHWVTVTKKTWNYTQ